MVVLADYEQAWGVTVLIACLLGWVREFSDWGVKVLLFSPLSQANYAGMREVSIGEEMMGI